MRHLRSRVVLGSLVCVIVLGTAPASAGGSWFEPARDRYEPGEAATVVGYTGGGQLGWIEDGPFYAYLTPDPSGGARGGGLLDTSDIPLGLLLLQETGRGGYLSLRAAITFTVPPDLAPGEYGFAICNDPCTTGLGDFIGGSVWVGMDPPSPFDRSDWPADDPARMGAPASVGLPAQAATTSLSPPTTPLVHPPTGWTTYTMVNRPPGTTSAENGPPSEADAGNESSFPWLALPVAALLAVALLRRRDRQDTPPGPGLHDEPEPSPYDVVGVGAPRD